MKGFSLIEFMVTIAAIWLLVLIVEPYVGTFFKAAPDDDRPFASAPKKR